VWTEEWDLLVCVCGAQPNLMYTQRSCQHACYDPEYYCVASVAVDVPAVFASPGPSSVFPRSMVMLQLWKLGKVCKSCIVWELAVLLRRRCVKAIVASIGVIAHQV